MGQGRHPRPPNPTARPEPPKRAVQFGGNPLRSSPYAVPGGNAAAARGHTAPAH